MAKQDNFQIGSIVNFPCHPWDNLTAISSLMGIGIVDTSRSDVIPCEVQPYVFDGIKFKLKLKPLVEGYAPETLYNSDFKQYLNQGKAQVRLY